MPGVVRIGDIAIGVCNHPKSPPHSITCTVTSASNLTTADGLFVARINDNTTNTCPYSSTGIIVNGSFITTDQNLGIARIGDTVQFMYGVAILISGSAITTTD